MVPSGWERRRTYVTVNLEHNPSRSERGKEEIGGIFDSSLAPGTKGYGVELPELGRL